MPCMFGIYLEKDLLKKEDIGGIVVAGSYPDHFILLVSMILQ